VAEHEVESPSEGERAAPERAALLREAPVSEIQRLNRQIGNRALARLMAPGTITHAELAKRLTAAQRARPGARIPPERRRYRLPTAADIKATLSGGVVPESEVIAAITTALSRMAKEGRLNSKDPVPTIIKKLFPAPGSFDEKEFAKVVSLPNRSQVYHSVADARTTVSAADKPKLIDAINKAVFIIETIEKKPKDLDPVFGAKAGDALTIYGKAKAALKLAVGNLDTMVETDYNLDDPEVGLGGWATPSPQHMHLLASVAQVKSLKESIATLIHEASHMADSSVDDQGYYGTTGFEALPEDVKVANAAHYEEVPRRYMGVSSYMGKTFKPGVSASGAPVTFEEEVQRDVQEYFRKAWDKAVDVHGFLRGIRKDVLAGTAATFTTHQARVLEVSKLEHLTVHKQTAGSEQVSAVDIVVGEGVARAMTDLQTIAAAQKVPNPHPQPKSFYVDKIITDTLAAYGQLTGNAADDRKLTDWLVAEYRKAL
jgi:hypothetical protein